MKSYFAYIRVSTAKQGQFGSSLQEQRDAIEAFAQRHELRLSQWFEDRETAAKKGRTQFVRMMASLEKGGADGVILHKIDRGARNLWDWARLQDLIDAGREVHFAHDNLDLQSRGGRLAADIQAVVAADYVRNLREEVRKGVRGRYKQGLFPRKAPVGYLDQGKAKPKIVDPVKGPVVRAAFELYATGRYSYGTLAEELRSRGLMRSTQKPYGPNNMTAILSNPFYMGLIHVKRTGETFQGIHEPLVSAALFKKVAEIREANDNRKIVRNDFTFRRMLRCGLCGLSLIGEAHKQVVYYRCHTAGCATTGIREDAVISRLRGVVERIELSNQTLEELLPYFVEEEEAERVESHKREETARLRVAALEDRHQRLTDAYLDQAIDRSMFETRKALLLVDLASAREALGDAQSRSPENLAELARQFLKYRNALCFGPIEGHLDLYRDSVEKLTSNRTLTQKNFAFALRSPFQELVLGPNSLLGAPRRDTPRKSTALCTRNVKWFGNALKQWAAEVDIEVVRK